MITFKIAKHSTRGYDIVEILEDGEVVGAIYPDLRTQRGVKVVSAHIAETNIPPDFEGTVVEDPGSLMLPIPSVNIQFKPETWFISEGKIIRPKRN